MVKVFLIALLLLPQSATSGQASSDPQAPTDFLEDSAVGIRALQTWYSSDTGLWRSTNRWNAANAVTFLARYSELSGSSEFQSAIANTFERNSPGTFLNEYYNDEGWWALAWAGAYESKHDARYLEMSELIFADMAKGWDDTCSGGIWWKKGRHYKNAIANELFLSTASRLANLVHDVQRRATYLDWAKREWQWFAASGMINSRNLVNDGLDSACQNIHKNIWTYNQGFVLGGFTL